MLTVEFPLFEFDGAITSDILAVSFPVFSGGVFGAEDDSVNIRFPVFETVNWIVSSSDMRVQFSSFAPVFSAVEGSTGIFLISLPQFLPAFTGQRGIELVGSFPLSVFALSSDIISAETFTIEFPVFNLSGWQLESPSTSSDYAVWVHHRDAERLSTYTQWPITSLAQFNGELVATLADGIYELGAVKDVTTDIAASLLWVPSVLGSAKQTRIDSVRITHRKTEKFNLVVVCDETEKRNIHHSSAEGQRGVRKDRVIVGKGLNGTYWQFGYENLDGGDFELVDVEVNSIHLSRHIK